jgi:lipoprotein-anchoring transpeptidase ErfK/SrfK/putative cell wall-binding protein
LFRRSVVRTALSLLLVQSVVVAAAAPALAAWPQDPARLSVAAERLAGANRFSTAVEAAKSAYPGWTGIEHVVVVSGDDRAMTDPLAASGLCWAYDAPLLLTSGTKTPSETRAALEKIVSVNTTVTVHVVGGPAAVPANRVAELKSIVGAAGTVEQPWTTGDRYHLAEGIAKRMREVAAETSREMPAAAFIVNGSERQRLSDALAASAVSRSAGIPVLLTGRTSVPPSTLRALQGVPSSNRVVVGGTVAVSDDAYHAAGAGRRWHGADRYSTAANVATRAIARGWASGKRVGLAAGVPDALAGAAAVGRTGGVMLVTATGRLPKPVWAYLTQPPASVARCSVFGGERVVSKGQYAELRGAPGQPSIRSGMPEKLVAGKMRVAGSVYSNTTEVVLYVGGKRIANRSATPYGSYDFGWVASPSGRATVEVRATNPDGKTASASRTVERLKYPYATCIVVDKSEFRLYWIKDNRLVKTYPVAVGRVGATTPSATWKIQSKYYSDPGSVYGPRKMRLYRKTATGYTYTRYLIHGTNNPASIGTRASAGCIRMYNKDVLELFPQVPIGTMVVTRD